MANRPKGYIDWTPPPHVAVTLDHITHILREYSGYGPMTVRQIFYRLVGNYEFEKTEKAYNRLAEWLVKARRAQIIGFDRIRDDGGTSRGGDNGWPSLDAYLNDLAEWSTTFEIDKTIGQPHVIELWCEAEGMVPMLSQMVAPWNVRVTGSGGFSSVTVTHEFAQRVVRRKKPTVLLHVGDFDPSGESIFRSMCEDIGAFTAAQIGGYLHASGEVENSDEEPVFIPRRVALTAGQVEEHDLPTAPPKASDSRSARWVGETTQLEAMPPDLLEDVVTEAVQEWVDQKKIDDLVTRQESDRALVGDKVRDAIDVIRGEL